MTEHDHQKIVVDFCRKKGLRPVSIPNGFYSGAKNKFAYINKMKAEGLCNGFPDLMVFIPDREKIIFIEMKKSNKEKPSKEQEEWIEFLTGMRLAAKVCYGSDDAIDYISKQI